MSNRRWVDIPWVERDAIEARARAQRAMWEAAPRAPPYVPSSQAIRNHLRSTYAMKYQTAKDNQARAQWRKRQANTVAFNVPMRRPTPPSQLTRIGNKQPIPAMGKNRFSLEYATKKKKPKKDLFRPTPPQRPRFPVTRVVGGYSAPANVAARRRAAQQRLAQLPYNHPLQIAQRKAAARQRLHNWRMENVLL